MHPTPHDPSDAVTRITHNYPESEKCSFGSSPQPASSESVAADEQQLDDRKRVALELMLTGATLTHVAAAVGISRKTLYNWRTEDAVFRDELNRRRSEILDSSVDRFRDLLGKSMELLDKQIRDPFTTTALRAARTVLVMSGVGKIAVPREAVQTESVESQRVT